ncbi:MAG: heavy-metal-associated domain-containing protein [Anaerosomatales bacterium]
MLVRPVAARLRAPLATTIAVALALTLAVPLSAAAAPLANMDFTLLVTSQGTGNPLLLVAGQLPEGTELPAELALPVPEGSIVEWSGEIVGQSIEEDEAAPATIETRDGVTVAVLEMNNSRIGQVEVSFPGAVTPSEGDTFTGAFEVTAPTDAEMVRVAIGLAPGTQAAALPDNVLSAQGPQGYTYYYRELGEMSAGDPIAFSLDYREISAPPAAGTGGSPSGSAEVPPLVIVLIAAVLAGAVLMVLASRARSRGTEAEEFEGDDVVLAEDSSVVEPAALESETVSELESEPEIISPSPGWLTPQRLVIIAGVLVVGIIAAVILGGQQGQIGVTESADGWITQRISTASSESSLDLNVQIGCECPPAEEAPKMFEALRQVPGVAHAALHEATLLMRIEYDPALTNEAAIGLALRGAGYLP